MIAPDVIDRIRERTSLAEVVGQSIKLERRGRTHVGLCPFHKEKSPSFNVNDERGFYHCFGCHASGDVFKYVQALEGLSFIEAVRQLGERAGIEVTDDLTDAERKQRSAHKKREEDLFRVNSLAASYFERMLVEHRHKDVAHEELARRALPYSGPASEILKSFRVGYAPDGWDGLSEYLKAQGVDARAAEAVGLIAPRKHGGGYYDRFRHRLMFAVVDLQGRVVAFSGRALAPVEAAEDGAEAPAKYINSPESPIYKKRETVFGLYQARTALRSGPCLLVEGNFDVVSLHARGFPGAVAPLGTAFTAEQGRQIRRFTTEVVFLFDGDVAGRKAVAQSRAICRESGLNARVATLPDGMDPDDFSRQRGPEALGNMLRAARGMLDHLIKEVLDGKFDVSDAAARAKQVRELIESEEDPTVRALARQSYSELMGARLNVADARTLSALQRSMQPGPTADAPSLDAARARVAPSHERSRASPEEIDRRIVGALLDYPELLDSELLLAYSGSMQGDLAVAILALRKAANSPGDGSAFEAALARMPETLRPFVQARLAAPLHAEKAAAEVELTLNLKRMQSQDFSRQTKSTLDDIERARSEGDVDKENELLRAQLLRARQRHGL